MGVPGLRDEAGGACEEGWGLFEVGGGLLDVGGFDVGRGVVVGGAADDAGGLFVGDELPLPVPDACLFGRQYRVCLVCRARWRLPLHAVVDVLADAIKVEGRRQGNKGAEDQ